ncbi:MAG: DUF1007 family protein [Marinibacterium sp.]|nr:DUF1007 family protein [Marinibacterium sp.]
MRHRLCLFVILSGVWAADPAVSHPHVFVDTQAGFQFAADGRLEMLRVVWTYDAFTSLTLFEILDLDKDGDGQLNDADRAAIVKGETEWQEGYVGDMYLEKDGANIPLARPVDGAAWMANDRISVSFDLPLAAPFDANGTTVLRVYDPSYYYAYDVVALIGGAKEGCAAAISPFEPDTADEKLLLQLAALSREETPEQENVGRLFADEVWLTCG